MANTKKKAAHHYHFCVPLVNVPLMRLVFRGEGTIVGFAPTRRMINRVLVICRGYRETLSKISPR